MTDTTPATPCRCGHDKARHLTDTCQTCDGPDGPMTGSCDGWTPATPDEAATPEGFMDALMEQYRALYESPVTEDLAHPATPDEAAARYPYHESALLVDALEFAHQRALVGLVHTAPDWRDCEFFPCNAYDAIHAASLSRQQGDAVAARVDEAMVGRVARALCDERGEDWDWTVAHDPGFADALRTDAREALLGVGDRDGGQR